MRKRGEGKERETIKEKKSRERTTGKTNDGENENGG